MVKEKHYYTIQASLARTLQRKVNSGQMNVTTMWSEVTAALKPFVLPQK